MSFAQFIRCLGLFLMIIDSIKCSLKFRFGSKKLLYELNESHHEKIFNKNSNHRYPQILRNLNQKKKPKIKKKVKRCKSEDRLANNMKRKTFNRKSVPNNSTKLLILFLPTLLWIFIKLIKHSNLIQISNPHL